MKDEVLVVGAGQMAVDYSAILKKLQKPFSIVGRGENSARKFEESTGVKVFTGGISKYLSSLTEPFSYAIVAVGVEELLTTTTQLLEKGFKNILVEKPGGLNIDEIKKISQLADTRNAKVAVAYNRRFYSSIIKAQEIIKEDGGVTSFFFEFTEWSHQIVDFECHPGVKKNWLLANSSHVIDLAFYLGGIPQKINCYSAGELTWHEKAVFAGSGMTDNGALFSYMANWAAPGRWGVEFLTKKHRLILRPLEQLHIQKIGSVAIEKEMIDDALDKEFKPGLFKQVEEFILNKDIKNLLQIKEQVKMAEIYHQIMIGSLYIA